MPAFLATIRHIRPQPAFTPFYALNERDRARLMYLTELTLPDSYADLPTGMNVEVMLP
jgi:HlyD family secretion protein